jgi:hypothetical protein
MTGMYFPFSLIVCLSVCVSVKVSLFVILPTYLLLFVCLSVFVLPSNLWYFTLPASLHVFLESRLSISNYLPSSSCQAF